MLRNLFVKVLCVLLAVAVPAAAGNLNGAVLAAQSASVNGQAVEPTSTVFEGDQIAVSSDAVIRLSGSTISLPANSKLRYGAAQIQLESGTALVATRSGMGVKLGNVTIAPAGKTARFQVSTANGVEKIVALEGSLTVSNGVQSYTLPAGKEMTKMRAAAPQSGAEDFGLPGWAVATIIAAAIAVTVGVIVAVQNDDESPVVP